jgi:2-methylcitrate dehydratase PrpD
MTSFTADVAAKVAEQRYDDLPADVVELVRQCVLDWYGVTLAGSREPAAWIVLAEAVEECPTGGAATVVGRADRLPASMAALVNGTASHALDYDDVNSAMNGHPTVPVLSALLALAETRAASGRDVVCAFVAGYEAECRVGRALGSARTSVVSTPRARSAPSARRRPARACSASTPRRPRWRWASRPPRRPA